MVRVLRDLMKLSASFSPDRAYRYVLERTWSAQPPLAWVLLNPSTADESRDDPTVKRCIEFSINSGYGGCQIFNLFAWRSTNPKNLVSVEDPVGRPENDDILKFLGVRKTKIVCAWGCMHKKLLWRPLEVLKFLWEPDSLYYLRPTEVHGEPHHPLYLPSRLRPIPMNRARMIKVYEKRIAD
jgi:hypothetical protein